ncbi:hypothetical protein BH24DEI2_BH24DEI2_15760 [soil metagenome]
MPRYLADTNVLLRYADTGADQHSPILRALEALTLRQDEVVIVPQTIYEFWSVATRPADKNGLGWESVEVRRVVDKLVRRFALLHDTPRVFTNWLELVTTHDVKGKQVHDARLVAAMQTHGLSNLLTLNVKDFERYPVTPVHPDDVSEG